MRERRNTAGALGSCQSKFARILYGGIQNMKAIIPTLSKRQLRQAAEEVKRTYDNENRKALMRVIYISVIALHRNAGYGAERCRKHIKHIQDIH